MGFELSLETSIEQKPTEEVQNTTKPALKNNLNQLINEAAVKVAESAPKHKARNAPMLVEKGTTPTPVVRDVPRAVYRELSVGNVSTSNIPSFGSVVQIIFFVTIISSSVYLMIHPELIRSFYTNFRSARSSLDRGSEKSLDLSKALSETFKDMGTLASSVQTPKTDSSPVSNANPVLSQTASSPAAGRVEGTDVIFAYQLRDEEKLKSFIKPLKCNLNLSSCLATILHANFLRDVDLISKTLIQIKSTYDEKSPLPPIIQGAIIFSQAHILGLKNNHKNAQLESLKALKSGYPVPISGLLLELAATESLYLNDHKVMDEVLAFTNTELKGDDSPARSKILLLGALQKNNDPEKLKRLMLVPDLRKKVVDDIDISNALLRTVVIKSIHPFPDLFEFDLPQKLKNLSPESNSYRERLLTQAAYSLATKKYLDAAQNIENLSKIVSSQEQISRLFGLAIGLYLSSPESFHKPVASVWGLKSKVTTLNDAQFILRYALIAHLNANSKEALVTLQKLAKWGDHPYAQYWSEATQLYINASTQGDFKTLNQVDGFLRKNPQSPLISSAKVILLGILKRPTSQSDFKLIIEKQRLDFDNYMLYENLSGPFNLVSSL